MEASRTVAVDVGPWKVLGPFDNADRVAETSTLPGMDPVELDGTYIGLGGRKVQWGSWDTILGRRGRFGKAEARQPVACLLYRELKTETPQTVLLGLGNHRRARAEVYLNGRKIQTADKRWAPRSPEQNLLKVPLPRGTSRLVVKYCGYNAWVRIDWAQPDDLRRVLLRGIAGRLGQKFGREAFRSGLQAYLIRSHWRRTDDLQSGGNFAPATRRAVKLCEDTLALLDRAGVDTTDHQRRLSVVARRVAAAEGSVESLYYQVRSLRRQAILQHPLLQFDRLLINLRPPPTYSHMCDQYLARHARSGPGLAVLENWRSDPRPTLLLEGKLPEGSVLHPDLSFDARRVVFSWADFTVEQPGHRRFHLYEINVDGTGLRQLTGDPQIDPLRGWAGRETVGIEDFDPCYLPDGGIVFVSTRNQGFGRCHSGRYTPSYVLYRLDGDGATIRRISFGEANEWDPSVLRDGSLIYTRWDYINRHDTVFQSLWTTRPDGTATAHFYGNYTRNPCMTAEARQVPGSDLVVSTAMGHHSHTAGSLILVDRSKGTDGEAPVTRLTPEVRFPETEGWPDRNYASPWPLSEDLYLAAYSGEPLLRQGGVQTPAAYGIVLVDTLGGRELIYRELETSCYSPIPLRPRSTPPAIPSTIKPGDKTGTFYLSDVYDSRQPIPAGSVKALRVVRIHGQPNRRARARSQASNEIVKSVVGTVPVEPDGSVAFRAPADVPLLLQALDDKGISVLSMRSQVYVRPGEKMGCAGCHEADGNVPSVGKFPSGPIRDIEPSPGHDYAGGLSFMRTVQPVLDRYCISCHGLEREAGKINLLGTPKGAFNEAYLSLTRGATDRRRQRKGDLMVVIAQRNMETWESTPGDYGARAGKLAELLAGPHRKSAPLDEASWSRIISWLDLNGQCYGTYRGGEGEVRKLHAGAMAKLRTHVREVFGEALAKQPDFALVNSVDPLQSRILLAPLAKEAGGWGQMSPGWTSRNDSGYRKMLKLVTAAAAVSP